MERDTILLTGATGALGSMLLPRLLGKGYHVICLVRGKNRAEAQKRVTAMVGTHPNLRVIRGDITEPRCGIYDEDREHLRGNVGRIFHCAASISFQDKSATHNANVNGVHHMLELADILDAWQIVHVSTAYVAGDARSFTETDSPSPMSFRPRNYYEETKQLGETMVRAWGMERDDRRLMILRPSILIGCEDGTSPTFDAFYGYFRPIQLAATALRRRAAKGKLLPRDVSMDGERVSIPLVLQASATASLNLVPIDWCASTMVELLELPPRNDVFHLVNPKPPLVRWVIDTSLKYLKIEGVRVVGSHEAKSNAVGRQSELVGKLQSQIDGVLDQYLPYTNSDITFGVEATAKALGKRFVPPPMLDVAYIERLLRYAIGAHWGQRVPVSA